MGFTSAFKGLNIALIYRFGTYSKPEVPLIPPSLSGKPRVISKRFLAYFCFKSFRNDRKGQQFWWLRPVILPIC